MLKSLLLVLLLVAANLPARAQTAAVAAPTTGQYQYCNLICNGLPSHNVELDYGQHAKKVTAHTESDAIYSTSQETPLIANPELAALSKQIKQLDSPMLALNYLSSQGWEYVGVTSVSPVVVIYVVRRRTP